MRERKYRVWDKGAKKFHYFNLVDLDKGRMELGGTQRGVEDFTGLHDKNGKEIYEGDILSSEYPRENCKNCHPVVWRDGSWIVDHSINDCCRPWRGNLRGHHNSEEVIGNIHQNPDLLKV